MPGGRQGPSESRSPPQRWVGWRLGRIGCRAWEGHSQWREQSEGGLVVKGEGFWVPWEF